MTTLTKHATDALELAAKAPVGPYHTGGTFNPDTPDAFRYVYPPVVTPGDQSSRSIAINVPVAVAELFAAARTLVPALAKAMLKLEEAIAARPHHAGCGALFGKDCDCWKVTATADALREMQQP